MRRVSQVQITKLRSCLEFTAEEVPGTSSAVEAGHDPQTSLDEEAREMSRQQSR